MTVEQEVRLFWVVDSVQHNREIFPTKKLAQEFADKLKGDYNILISEVCNWYVDGLVYNYDDHADTFTDIITIVRTNQ